MLNFGSDILGHHPDHLENAVTTGQVGEPAPHAELNTTQIMETVSCLPLYTILYIQKLHLNCYSIVCSIW